MVIRGASARSCLSPSCEVTRTQGLRLPQSQVEIHERGFRMDLSRGQCSANCGKWRRRSMLLVRCWDSKDRVRIGSYFPRFVKCSRRFVVVSTRCPMVACEGLSIGAKLFYSMNFKLRCNVETRILMIDLASWSVAL